MKSMCAMWQPSVRAAAELCVKLADALHHAHQAGVIHRDQKPSNIIIDEAGEPHIMDFGLAKRDSGDATLTADGTVVGTPAYMSPEQAKGEAHQAGPSSDIYSLGVILYELLTGERPFRGDAQMLLQQIVHDEPSSLRKLKSSVPRDLETICLKCLEKESAKRYGDAQDLADDLRRFLQGKPIHARRITTAGRVWRWCRRKPVVAGLAAALAVAVLAGTVGIVHQESLVRHEADRNRTLLYASDMSIAQEDWNTGNLEAMRERLLRHKPAAGRKELRGFEWHLLWTLCHESASADTLRHEGDVMDVAYSPDGSIVATLGCEDGVKIWNVASRA
jgi:hypothetical protein